MKKTEFLDSARTVLNIEAQAISRQLEQLGETFEQACQRILDCDGRVVVTGMGKSGHIANKIAATLASTGTPAFFVHPGEASHGDLGMITPKDLVLAISNSGETSEVLSILPIIKRMGVGLIGLASVRCLRKHPSGPRSLSHESSTDSQHYRDSGGRRCARNRSVKCA